MKVERKARACSILEIKRTGTIIIYDETRSQIAETTEIWHAERIVDALNHECVATLEQVRALDQEVRRLDRMLRKVEMLVRGLVTRQEILKNGKEQYGQDDEIFNAIEKLKELGYE